ncbi:hypothetical protein RDWZM_008639 [Blomia tropicalis]|uniref:Strumpellin n=1 Tax=Blomia tropicalis TaxID=40697 RepID=A0A9Q0M413_BLOTA|nr:hypothetical protein BLOT_004340 [Blomia tropicalis]KAJ6217482.1 hypothetical protein RDWZM_008639 [Blomia tropicalis]
MNDFLDPSNVCGQNLLRIVSHGNATVAKLYELADMIPSVFRLATKQDQTNFSDLIVDFSYFKVSDSFDRKIDNDKLLQEKDEGLRETYLDLLLQFYILFENIHQYSIELERFLNELDEGVYIQQSIESVLLDYDGKQLLCEALYLMGVILFTMDQNIEGIVRERMLVAYYRYSAHRTTSDSNIDDVCNLVRSTGFVRNGKRPTNYPEDFFKRAKIRPSFARLVIGRLRSDDVYNMISSYPRPEHRSVGLANQGAMLFICLYFAPEMLHNESAVMREIVDKFFADNFVISVYMGTIANLIEHWDSYKAAKAALNNTLDIKNVRSIACKFNNEMSELNPKIAQLLKEGVLTEENILNRINEHMNTCRQANVALRWVMLHTVPLPGDFLENASCIKRCKQLREQIVSDLKFNPIQLFRLLLNTSEFELRIRETYKQLLSERLTKLNVYKNEAFERINELAEVFSGSKPLNRLTPNDELQKWFQSFAKQIEGLQFTENFDQNQINWTSRKIIQLIKALEEVHEFQQLESNMHVKQFLSETHNYLHLMVKTISIREEVLITQQIIADLSYAWKIIDICFTKFMQDGIKHDPSLVSKLRAAFLKLASALDLPLLRINQAGSNNLMTVSKYYSNELVSYVRKVLHIIPETMFSLMAKIISIQSNKLKELPTRLMKDQLKNCAQLDDRFEIAQLTHSISVFTEGVLAMKTTLVGVVEIDPKKLLEDGIRRELVRQVALALHNGLVFNAKTKSVDLIQRLSLLVKTMDGFRRSFEYIQDYVCINGLKMWQEELSRILNYNVEQECNAFMRQKVLDYQSIYQLKSIPIPIFLPLDPYSLTFIGRLVKQITNFTDPKNTIYVYSLSAWYDSKTHQEIIDGKLFSLILKSIGVTGTNGIDRLISFQIVSELNIVLNEIDANFGRNKSINELLSGNNGQLNSDTPNGIITAKNFVAYYFPLVSRMGKIFTKLSDSIGRIGQLQILRLSLAHELSMASKFQARQLSSALSTLNSAIKTELEQKCRSSKSSSTLSANQLVCPIFEDESPLLYELSNYLEYNGITDTLSKVFIHKRLPPHLDTILLLLLASQMSKFVYVKEISGLTSSNASLKSGEAIDGVPYVIGILTLLRQFHVELANRFLKLCSQFVNAWINASAVSQTKQTTEMPTEAINMLHFLHYLEKFGCFKRQQIAEYLPSILFDQFNALNIAISK